MNPVKESSMDRIISSIVEELRIANERRKGTLVGYSIHGNDPTPFRLSRQQLRGHSVLCGPAGSGKTALMGHLANAAIQADDALVVIDLDGDLAPDLVAQVPLDRARDVCWIDFDDEAHIPGFNLVDVSQGENCGSIVKSFMLTAPRLWGRYWNRDVAKALQIAVSTLVAANRALVRQKQPQFTLFDVERLFQLPTFCRRLLRDFITDEVLIEWWNNYLELQSLSFVSEWMAAIMVPLHRLVTTRCTRNILGQSTSTFNLRERLQPRRITVFNLRSMTRATLTTDLRRWLAALVTDRVNLTILTRQRVAPKSHAPGIVVVVNGNLAIPRMDEPVFLKNIHTRGTSYILSGWYMDKGVPEDYGMPQAAVANATNLFIFWGASPSEDVVSAELGDAVLRQDIANLPVHTCYVRAYAIDGDMSVTPILTLDPFKGDIQAVKKILGCIELCGCSPVVIESEQDRFRLKWYERELAALRSNDDIGMEIVNP